MWGKHVLLCAGSLPESHSSHLESTAGSPELSPDLLCGWQKSSHFSRHHHFPVSALAEAGLGNQLWK